MLGDQLEEITPQEIGIQEASFALIGIKSTFLDANVWQFDDGSVMMWDDGVQME